MNEEAAANEEKHSILSVGLLCLDLVNVLDSYPGEDTDNRVREQVGTVNALIGPRAGVGGVYFFD